MEFEQQEPIKYYASGLFQDLLIAITVVVLYLTIGIGYYDYAIEGNPEEGLVEFNLFTIIFIIFSLAIGSLVFYLIFTKLKGKGIRFVYSIVLSVPLLLLLLEIFSLLTTEEMPWYQDLIFYLLSLGIPVFGAIFLYVYVQGIPRIGIRNTGIILSSVSIGRVMAMYFDIVGIIVFAIVLALFDIYSVFRGPLAKVMGKPERIDQNGINHLIPPRELMDRRFNQICKQGTPVLLSYQNTILGVGDVLFFAILMYKATLEWNFIGLLVTLVMIMIGSSGTLFLLRRLSPLPGLPLPVFMALLGYAALNFLI